MRQLRVWTLPIGIAAMTTAAPALAEDSVVLVGCDLLSASGPTALYRQTGGDTGFGSGFSRGDDVRGRDCAEVLAEVASAGLKFRAFRVTGLNLSQGIWFWETP